MLHRMKEGIEMPRPKATPIILTVVLVVIVQAVSVGAISRLVKPDGTGDYPTIQDAIDAASDGDSVVLDNGKFTGPGNKNLDTQGKAIVVMAADWADSCIIDCELDGRGFYVHSGETASTIIRGIEVRLGDPPVSNDRGGGILCIDTSPTVVECVFRANWADSGGAVYLRNSNSQFIRNAFIDNYWWPHPPASRLGVGAAIYCTDSDISVIDSYFNHNLMNQGKGCGVQAHQSTLRVIGNLFYDNGWIMDDQSPVYADSS
jgi:hypothetical protein